MYGAIIKNYIETKITGIERWEKYEHPNWANYDSVLIGKMPKVFTFIHDTYDLIIMTDVIEHFDFKEGREVVNTLKTLLNPKGVLLISTPSVFMKQDAVGGNKLEIHKELWLSDALPEFESLREP